MPAERRTGDTTKKANHSNRHHDSASGSALATPGATGVTPLLLRRLQAIFDGIQGSDVMTELDMAVRTEKLRSAGKEVHVISRTACALPKEQRQMVTELAENVKAVLATLKNMSQEEVAVSVERFKARKAAQQKREAEAPAATAVEAPAAPEVPATSAEPAPLTPEQQGRDLVPRFTQWSVLFRSEDFARSTIEARQRAIAFATQDVHHATALLEKLTDDLLLDKLIAVIEETTEAIMFAKKMVAVAIANQPDAATTAARQATEAQEEEEDSFSVGAITEVLSEFHEALNAEELLQVEPALRVTLVTAILDRLREIEVQLLPKMRGDDKVKADAAGSLTTLINRAVRLQQS